MFYRWIWGSEGVGFDTVIEGVGFDTVIEGVGFDTVIDGVGFVGVVNTGVGSRNTGWTTGDAMVDLNQKN